MRFNVARGALARSLDLYAKVKYRRQAKDSALITSLIIFPCLAILWLIIADHFGLIGDDLNNDTR